MVAALTQAPAPTTGKTKGQLLSSYHVTDFPAITGQEEEWRFTPLRRLRGLTTADLTTPLGPAPKIEHEQPPAGVSICMIDRTDPRVGSVLTPFDRISAFAFHRTEQALLVNVAPGAAPATPMTIRVVGSGSADVSVRHTFLSVGELAQTTVVLDQIGSATLADNMEVSVGDGAHLTLVTVADWAPDAVQAQHVRIRLGRDARVTQLQVTLGGELVRQYTSVDYAGWGGDVTAYGLYFADGRQHFEHRQLVDHQLPDCRSFVSYRGALQGKDARTVWVGDVLIRATASGTDTYEINRNLVLTDGARADSVPNLEIETGEVVGAGHASTTGRFDEEQMFYLMSRGIPAVEARQLVVRGFFAELLNRVPVAALRERLSETIDLRLAKAGD